MNPPVEIVADETVALVNQGALGPPAGWASRARYLGEAGSRNWLAVVHEPTYPLRDPDALGLRANRLAALAGRRAATFVSLGPGDGLPDVELVRALQDARAGALKYIPVEISRPLLEAAIANLWPHANVPAGILCDFEAGQEFLARALARYARRPILFALLGGTLGNLDEGEGPFFEGFRRLMRPDDAFLIDVPLAGPGWTAADEPRLRTETYTSAFRRFLAGGLGGAGGTAPLEQWVGVARGHDAATGAEVVTVTDRRSGRAVLTFRRYRWQPLLDWLQGRGFAVEFARSSVASEQDRFGMGVVLLAVR
jgi:hypothetical protein